MTATSNKLTTVIEDYLSKVESKTVTSAAPLVFDVGVPIIKSSPVTYDLKELFPKHARYDLKSANVVVLMEDTEEGSPTLGYYINSETHITCGVDDLGIVHIHNSTNKTVIACIKILAPSSVK